MASGHKWRPLQRATPKPPSPEIIAAWQEANGCDAELARKLATEHAAKSELWLNDLYQVSAGRYTAAAPPGRCWQPSDSWVHLCIRRVDGYPGRDWRHFQQIKNEIVGPECEGVELYPAESRLTDEANKYHVWCSLDPTFRFPWGFGARSILGQSDAAPGLRQAPPMQFADGSAAP